MKRDAMALQVSVVALVLLGLLWKENYGDRSFSAFHHTQEASRVMARKATIIRGRMIVSCVFRPDLSSSSR